MVLRFYLSLGSNAQLTVRAQGLVTCALQQIAIYSPL